MKNKQIAAINLKVMAILALVMILVGVGAVGGHYYRKRAVAGKALAAGNAALSAKDFPEAAKQLRIYLSKYPDDEPVLLKYAEACLAVRPMRQSDLSNATKAYRRVLRNHMGDRELSERLAKLYFASGEFGEAGYIARQRLENAPTDSNAVLWQARSLLGLRKFKEAGDLLARFVEQKNDAPVEMYILLSDIAIQENANEKAFNWLDLALKRNPESAEALARRGKFYLVQKENAVKAQEDLEAASRLQSSDLQTRLLLAEQWLQLRELDRAETELQTLEAAASRPYEFDFEQQDMMLGVFRASARLAMRRGDRERMVELADKALVELKENHRLIALDDASRLYLSAGKLDQARTCIEEYRASIKQNQRSNPAVNERLAILDAALANSENNPYEAIRHLEDVLAVGKARDEVIWRYLAHAYSETGQDRRALAALQKYIEQASDDRLALLELSRLYYKMGEWTHVQKYAQMAENLRQDDLEATLMRIEGTLRLIGPKPEPGRVEPIVEELANLRNAHPKRVEVRLLQAMTAEALQKKAEAVTILKEAIAECDQPLVAYIQLVELLRAAGQYEDAILICRAGMEKYPETSVLPIGLADVQRAAGKKEEARKTLELAAGSLPAEEAAKVKTALARLLSDEAPGDAGILLRQIAKDRPKDVAARQMLLDLPEFQSDEAQAQRIIDEIRAIEGERGLRWSYEQARLLLRNPAWKSRQPEILQLLMRCTEGDPGWSAPVLTLGWVYESLGRDEKAEELYNRFMDKNPKNMTVVSRLLDLLERQGRFIAATQILENLPSSAPLFSDHRARLAIGRGDYETAQRDLRARIASNPKDATSRILLAKLIYQQSRNVDEAMKLLEEAQQQAPQFISAVSTRVALLHAEGRRDEAIALLDTEVQRRNDFFAHQLRAEYYALLGERDKAEADYKTLTTFPASAVEGYLKLGNFYENTGRVDQAIAAYEEGLKLDSGRAEVRRAIVRALLFHPEAENRERGQQLLDKMLAETPQEPSLVALQAAGLLKQNQPESRAQALKLLERVVELDPRNVVAHIHLIRDTVEQGDLKKAAERAARALGANPDDVDLLLVRANIEKELNNRVAARESARKALDRDPQNVAARLLLVQLALAGGDLEEAEKINNEAVKLAPEKLEVQLAAAEIFSAKQQDDRAIEMLEAFRTTENGQKSAKVALNLADLYRKRGDFAKSGERVDEAEKLAPNEFSVFFARLRLYAAQKDIDNLLKLLDARIQSRPTEAPALTSAAAVLIANKDTAHMERVKPLFEAFIEKNPQNPDGHLAMAILAYQTNDKPRALKAYRRVLDIDPYQREALNNLAWILAEEMAKYQEALDLANKGVLRYPDDPSLLNTRGVINFNLNKLPEARVDFEKCIRVVGTTAATRARSLIYLSRIAFRQGDKEKARTLLAEAQEIDTKSQVLNAKERDELQKLIGSESTTKPTSG